ncbi:hypothetical protein [Domibacillus iocasae]|uniref:Uncharacterized protein n=1 Tax=Domibacillus iocasae TaxID=1714016 RepID=A0A1E7DTZ4_9BACI|nr:hypothetical protein [Domibacillus iocasae]OES46557.1 hypothetical protein BA724_00425 [Domibacillus iocasae]
MKKSLIDMLLNGTPPDDYLKREADELRSRENEAVPATVQAKKERFTPELKLLLVMTGLTLGMMGIGYMLIF